MSMQRIGSLEWEDATGRRHARNVVVNQYGRRLVHDGDGGLVPCQAFLKENSVNGHVISYGGVAGYERGRHGHLGILVRNGDEVPGADARILIDSSRVDAVLIDLDGTLADSGGVWRLVLREFLGERGVAVGEEYEREFFELGFFNGLHDMRRRFSIPESFDEIRLAWRAITNRAYAEEVELFDGCLACVAEIRAAGIPVALVTMNAGETLSALSDRTHVADPFDAVVYKTEQIANLSKEEVFMLGCEKVGVPMEGGRPTHPGNVVVIEDSPLSLATARAAGFTTIGHIPADPPLEGMRGKNELTVEGESLATFEDWSEISII